MAYIFSVPDKSTDYQAYTLFVLTIIWTVVTGIIVSTGIIYFPGIWYRWLMFFFISVCMCVISLTLIKRGRIKLGNYVFSILLWLYITIPCYTADGIQAPGIITQVSVILTAGILLGPRGGIAIGLLTIAADYFFVYMENNGLLPAPHVNHTPLTRWIGAIIPFGSVIALQYYATNHLQNGLEALKREIKKREEIEKLKDDTVFKLNERVKELRTLFNVSRILQQEDFEPNIHFRKIAEAMPSGWQYPEITAAKVIINTKEFTTENFIPTEYTQRAATSTSKGTKITIEIVYLQAMPQMDEGPFQKEERELINTIVELMRQIWSEENILLN